jgi:hypothetical protein
LHSDFLLAYLNITSIVVAFPREPKVGASPRIASNGNWKQDSQLPLKFVRRHVRDFVGINVSKMLPCGLDNHFELVHDCCLVERLGPPANNAKVVSKKEVHAWLRGIGEDCDVSKKL